MVTARRAVPRKRSRGAWILLTGSLVACAALGIALVVGLASGRPTTVAKSAASPSAAPVSTAGTTPGAEASSTVAADLNLTVMSFNILTSDPIIFGRNPAVPRAELAFAARAPGIAAQVTAADPDVVALQENFGDPYPYDLLRTRLAAYEWVNPSRQVTILARKSRFTVITSGYRDLNQTEKGFLSWARLRDGTTGRAFWVFDVHLRAGSTRANARVRSTETDRVRALMLKLNPGLAEPVVLMGDLNTLSRERRTLYRDPIVKLTAGGLVDAATVAAEDSSTVPGADSFHGFKATVKGRSYVKVVPRTGVRLDFIFVPKQTDVLSFGVDTGPTVVRAVVAGERVYRWKGVVPSDHSPVVAEIILKR
jgi:endonuclease/exonuclease/phosphatase family metal-dependent hydrolase